MNSKQKFLGVQGPFFKKGPGRRRHKPYKTGDLARWLDNGTVEFLGRIDQQIKIRGFRIEPGEIETTLLRCEGIEEALVTAREDNGGHPCLCAYIVLRPGASPGPGNTEGLNERLREYLQNRLPAYMIPAYFVLLQEIPLTSTGKPDRDALPAPRIEPVRRYTAPKNTIEKKIIEVWADVLNIDESVIDGSSNFFELGGYSLSAMQLVAELIKDFDIKISDIFEYPTAAGLAAKLSYKKDNLREIFETVKGILLSLQELPPIDPLVHDLKKEYGDYKKRFSREEIRLTGGKNYKNILLTGAAGYLGAHLVVEFLREPGTALFLLVRANTREEAETRLRARLIFYFGEDFYRENRRRLMVINGDLRKDNLAISDTVYAELAEKIDAVVHCAANVSHAGEYETFYKDNVLGTEHLLQFALAGQKKDFHFISTISVGEYTPGTREKENMLFTEYCLDNGQSYEHVYIKSKFEAEKKVLIYRDRGLNASIYRVGNLVFHSQTGKFQENIENNGFYAGLKAFISLGAVPEVKHFSLGQLTFIDYLARAVALIITKLEFTNETFHVYNDLELSACDFADHLEKVGTAMKKVDVERFLHLIGTAVDNEEQRPIVERLLFHSGILDGVAVNASAQEARSIIVKDRTDRILETLGFQWHTLSEEHIAKMIRHCREVGFLDYSLN